MFHLITDVQKEIISYLQPKEIIRLYHSCLEAKQCIDELSQHIGFIINCKVVVSKRDLKWFRKRNIQLNLYIWNKIIDDRNFRWYRNNKLHRDNDLPAFVTYSESAWYQNGKLHRDGDKPALLSYGRQYWYQHGVCIKNKIHIL
jgi:hypothetical protein